MAFNTINLISHSIDLDFKRSNFCSVSVEQYDKDSAYIEAALFDGGSTYVIPVGTTVSFGGTKPSSHIVLETATIEDNKIYYKISEQCTVKEGVYPVKFTLYLPNGAVKYTQEFKIQVRKAVISSDAIADVDEVNVLNELIVDASEAISGVNSTVTNINNKTLIIYKPYVANYTAIATTYPTPELGWTTQANDTGVRWRWDGTTWENIGVFSNDKVGDVTQLYTNAKQSVVASINENSSLLAHKAKQSELEIERNRITNLATLAVGSTTGDAELIDTRIGADGIIYPNAGTSVREQIKKLRTVNKTGREDIMFTDLVQGAISSTGTNATYPSRMRTSNYHAFENGLNIFIKGLTANDGANVVVYNATTNTFIKRLAESPSFQNYIEFTASSEEVYRFVFGAMDSTGTADATILNNFEITTNSYGNDEVKNARTDLWGFNNPSISDRLNNCESIIKSGESILKINEWENGALSSATGFPSTYKSSIRSIKYYNFANSEVITVTGLNGYGCKIYAYTKSGEVYKFAFATANYETNYLLATEPSLYYKFVIGDLTITTADSGTYQNGEVAVNVNFTVSRDSLLSHTAQIAHYHLNVANALVLQAKKNPFVLSPFNEGYVTFVFDDLRHDLDLVAAIFAEYALPLGLAVIPSYLNNTANGLTLDSNGFTVGMTMKEIVDKVVANGGEVMCHNVSPAITETNQYDYDFMYNYFVKSKESLENVGYTVRGIIRTGGTGAISGTPAIEKWLISNYEYSNLGTAVNFSQDRITINQPLDKLQGIIDDAVLNKKWIKFMCHTLDGTEVGSATNYFNETMLRNILSYCVSTGINVVTYGYIFDNFSSSRLLESLLV